MSRSIRGQQQVQEVCSAAIRALAGQPSLQLRGGRLFDAGVAAPPAAAHLHPSPDDNLHSFRGTADGLALRATGTDLAVHVQHAPEDSAARRLYDLLEQYRVEALVGEEYAGVRHNVQCRHQAWIEAFENEGLVETEQGIVIYTMALICRSRVTGIPIDEHRQDLIEQVRFRIAPALGGDMASLRSLRKCQVAYAPVAAHIASQIAAILRQIEKDTPADQEHHSDSRKRGIALWLGDQSDIEEEYPLAGAGQSRLLEGSAGAYRIFTRAYDLELDATSLVRVEVLRTLRERLDESVALAGLNVGRLARHLQSLFAVPADEGWNSAQEEGRVDGRLLPQLIASPTERRLFRQVRREPLADCVVSFLLDCSGSMKQYSTPVAVLADVLLRAMEQAGIVTELLGFTTAAWNGGRARREWQRSGCSAHPGRLNEALHIVFKPAGETWRRRRQAVAALLQSDFYREGVDGEAVDWACARLRARPEMRRILVVVSDGSPMDGSTSLANDPHYLDHHLQEVVAAQSAVGDLEIRGMGVGLDLSPYYDMSHVLDLSECPTMPVLLEVADLLVGRRGTSLSGRR